MLDVALVNTLASYGTLVLLLGSVAALVGITAPSLVPKWKEKFLAHYGIWLVWALATFATAVTLYYSEVLGILPCSLCWVQRIFLYPQVVILLIAAMLHDRRAALYSVALSVLGAVVALYHHVMQLNIFNMPCPADAGGAVCAVPTFMTWGFVTFPFMSFALFLFLILFMVYLRSIWRKYPQA